MPVDRISQNMHRNLINRNIGKNFQIRLPRGENWKKSSFIGEQTFSTDALRMKQGAGAGICGGKLWKKIPLVLETLATAFQAKLTAVLC